MRLWLPEREIYLLEMLRLEGCGNYSPLDKCPGKADCQSLPQYRCRDCLGTELYCRDCTVLAHQRNPLHRLQHWNGLHFVKTTLNEAGLRVQLGHPVGTRCYSAVPSSHGDFIVLDTLGVHVVALDFCNCESALSHMRQLLRMEWYPATATEPKSAITFRALEHLQMLSFESKGSAFEYFRTLSRLTDNTGVVSTKDRYEALLRMIRQWRHLRSLKRSGRGHDPAGIEATREGECAVLCPACPQPGKNLPSDWKEAPLHLQYDEKNDPSLGHGWQYFVEQSKFKAILDGFAHLPQEKSTCVSHNAVNLANTKDSQGKAATGIGTTDCARHNFKLPTSIGDLQKGERYVNMDYFFCQSLRHNPEIIVLNVSYDIACQWSKNLKTRLISYGSATRFSFNLTKGMGRTDGEAVERGWANINPAASSTREMGPGSRRDTLDDHFGDWNWKSSIILKLKVAVEERQKHIDDFNEFQTAVPDAATQWQVLVEAWEEDNTKQNPFESTVAAMTQASVRLALARAEATELERGIDRSLYPDVPPSILISAGLDLEDQQRRLQSDLKDTSMHATDNQRSKLQERSNSLRRRIEQWSKIQLLYMPGVSRLRISDTAHSDIQEEAAHNIKLYLPSQVVTLPRPLAVSDTLAELEWDLRCAQAGDALNDMRHHLRLSSHLWGFKDRFIRGQRNNTHSRGIINNVVAKVELGRVKYNAARAALVALSSVLSKETSWQNLYRPLEKDDVRGMKEGLEGESEGRRTLSWIWKAGRIADGNDNAGLLDATRIEWCRARARANRWTEEVLLLREEMRRTLAFLDWHAGWWLKQVDRRKVLGVDEPEGEIFWGSRPSVTVDEATGVTAYAHRQAALRRAMRDNFEQMWIAHPKLLTSPAPLVATTVPAPPSATSSACPATSIAPDSFN
ncbi:hypothetical protein BJ138DRAFT_1138292 [Hygrophoropsis aurantiaca]|uniref:Uncharacterized protein n=1 Tax=Hygrophoropsis aurantiaca TaxID=72124 RepID=A0ACB7ZWS9_9AGAM|nr:hypothetical protein BJ138DRAFT_1138292 [Hygrophoropsis aurantiaca]